MPLTTCSTLFPYPTLFRSPGVDEVVADRRPHAQVFGELADGLVLGCVVVWKRVDRNHRRHTVDLDVLDLLAQVGGAGQDIVRVLLPQLRGKWPACVHSALV